MILLKRGELNTMAVTVTEKSGGGFVNYRFVFKHDVTKEVFSIVLPITGNTPERIDYFQIDVDTVFESSDDGQFSYEVFTHGPDADQDYPEAKSVESGIMKLMGTTTTPVQYEGSPKEYITYGR